MEQPRKICLSGAILRLAKKDHYENCDKCAELNHDPLQHVRDAAAAPSRLDGFNSEMDRGRDEDR